eukprot:TRINITY_DN6709_c0_g1_i1.p1 TRINITY_DN6709_c0_g1~~TRINITY_DN6709_c0_g1_i1.p1  ORF type:complete len:218 (-),score=46.77 TRINITY_DN6709_c0_g1_i1:110-763(-)
MCIRDRYQRRVRGSSASEMAVRSAPAVKRPLKRRLEATRTSNADWSSRLSGMRARAEEVIGTLRDILERDLPHGQSWNDILPKFSIALSRLRVLGDDIRRDLSHSVMCPGRVGDDTAQVPNILRSKLDVEIENSSKKHKDQLQDLFPEAFDHIAQFERLAEWIRTYDEITKEANADVQPTCERAGLGQLRVSSHTVRSSPAAAVSYTHLTLPTKRIV